MSLEILGQVKIPRRLTGEMRGAWRGYRTEGEWAFRNHAQSPHSQTWCIPLRAGPDLASSFKVGVPRGRTPWWTVFKQGFMDVANDALRHIPDVAEVGNVLVVGLTPGGFIPEHVDDGPYAEYFERIHIVLDSEPGNWFKVDGVTYHPEPGNVFQFNHRAPHSVGNPTERTRVHIIMDVRLH